MKSEQFFFYNGVLFSEHRPVFSVHHPGVLYGDGIFETLLLFDGKIVNWPSHFSRLQTGMNLLGLEIVPGFREELAKDIIYLARKNHQKKYVRVRLTIFRSQNYFQQKQTSIDWMITTTGIDKPVFDNRGVKAVFYENTLKGTGELSNLKTNNYLLNICARQFAEKQQAQEAILLNSHKRICESSIANIFFVEEGKLCTPSLSEGCVAGVMRKWLIEYLPSAGISVEETVCSKERLIEAEEVFFTNAIRWVQPVESVEGKKYPVSYSKKIFDLVEGRLFESGV